MTGVTSRLDRPPRAPQRAAAEPSRTGTMTNLHCMTAIAATTLSLLLAACGGGSSGTSAEPPFLDPSDTQRAVAATATANSHPLCAETTLGPFYWEIGDANGAKVSGQVGASAPGAATRMSIASASKWVYSSYVVQRVGVRAGDVPFLNFTSGYSLFLLPLCKPDDTVGSCLADGNDRQNPDTIGKFAYDSGHMQHHAANAMGLGPLDNAALTAEIAGRIGNGFDLDYTQPQLAGGLVGNAAGYAAFLRRILRGELAMRDALGRNAVCTNPATCADAVASPIPNNESWSYSLGHWVETDPAEGDGAFSSAGALGFYPWIDSSKTVYGIIARRADSERNAGYNSARCGRLIRRAWLSGAPV
jgi:hypothetical protein